MENIQKIKNILNELYCKMYDEIKEYYYCPEELIKNTFCGVDELIKDLETKKYVEMFSKCAVYENGTEEYDYLNSLDVEQWENFIELLAINGYEPSYNSVDDVFVIH